MLKHRGLTLIELMITISIAGILLTLGLPSFMDFLRENRVVGAANELAGAFYTARSEAIKRGRTVQVCPDANGDSACDASTDWNDGLIIIEQASGTVLRQIAANPDVTIASSANTLDYNAIGTAAKTDISLTLDTSARYVCIIATGRLEVRTATCPA